MIAEFQKHDADAIGMSGLLVKSTVIMKEDLVTLNERELTPPVILGGAALNRRYVEEDLRAVYKRQAVLRRGRVRRPADHGRARGPQEDRERRQRGPQGAGESPAAPEPSRAWWTRHPRQHRREVAPAGARLLPGARPRRGRVPRPPLADPAARPGPARRRRSSAAGSAPTSTWTRCSATSTSSPCSARSGSSARAASKPAEYERQIADVARPALGPAQGDVPGREHPPARRGLRLLPGRGRRQRRSPSTRTTARRRGQRSTSPRQDHGDYLCLADYVEPCGDGQAVDYVGFMAVTMGREVTKAAHEWYDGRQVPGLPVPARPGRGVGRGAGRVLPQADSCREWGIGGEDSPRRSEAVQGPLPRLPVRLRLPRVPEPGGPGRSCSR